ncbi:MAG: alpha/beta hydrolase [Flavicella sp.]|nr:alpha/beta hydrolase [Flavicella sp.]MDG1805959.1 alpha/beta hydrolase [Flavicella sp.]MDG2279903.1 alpha/beta hydrolase [Flavicella sp.]
MKMKNRSIKGEHNKPILLDVCYKKNNRKKPLVIFCHGYKGYKDWGAFDLMSDNFIENDLFLVKFNFSHNGGTVENPIDFPDLEAFGENNYSKEQDDLNSVLDWVLSESDFKEELDKNNITLIGHSRGGGAVILKAAYDTRITKLVTWASVSDYKLRFPDGPILEHWKKEGVAYIENTRTLQQMPHYIQFYEDFVKNEEKLTIKTAAQQLQIPHLIVHGTEDATVPLAEAKSIQNWSEKSSLFIVEGGDHGFGAKQPWESSELPVDFAEVLVETIDFIKSKNE